jgi:hypothetical protein
VGSVVISAKLIEAGLAFGKPNAFGTGPIVDGGCHWRSIARRAWNVGRANIGHGPIDISIKAKPRDCSLFETE